MTYVKKQQLQFQVHSFLAVLSFQPIWLVCMCTCVLSSELTRHQSREGGRDELVDRRRERERRRERGRRRKLKQQQRILWGCSRLEMKIFFPLVPTSESRGATQQLRRGHMHPAITGAPGFLSPLQASWSAPHIQRHICFQSQNRNRWTLQAHTCKSHILICTQVVQRRAPYQSDQFCHAWLTELRFFSILGQPLFSEASSAAPGWGRIPLDFPLFLFQPWFNCPAQPFPDGVLIIFHSQRSWHYQGAAPCHSFSHRLSPI